jgi:hypothetical protein
MVLISFAGMLILLKSDMIFSGIGGWIEANRTYRPFLATRGLKPSGALHVLDDASG